jgi:hypothetical protein
MITRRRKRREWFWRSRRDGPPAIAEPDGRWRVTVGRHELGVVGSRAAVEELVRRLDAIAKQGVRDGER